MTNKLPLKKVMQCTVRQGLMGRADMLNPRGAGG